MAHYKKTETYSLSPGKLLSPDLLTWPTWRGILATVNSSCVQVISFLLFFIGTPKFSQKRFECSLIKVTESFEAWTRRAGFLCVAAERGEVRDAGEMSKKDTNSSTKGLWKIVPVGLKLLQYLEIQGPAVSPPLAFRPLWIAVKHYQLPGCKVAAHKRGDIKREQSTGYGLFMRGRGSAAAHLPLQLRDSVPVVSGRGEDAPMHRPILKVPYYAKITQPFFLQQ